MENQEHDTEEFTPRGSVAFFITLLIFFVVTWFAFYFELLSRG